MIPTGQMVVPTGFEPVAPIAIIEFTHKVVGLAGLEPATK